MNVYAVRDRMLDYFLPPFLAPNDNEASAAVAAGVNSDGEHALSKTPHYFELWRIAEIDENAEVKRSKEILYHCSSLIRTGVRLAGAESGGTGQGPIKPSQSTGPAGGDRGHPGTQQQADASPPESALRSSEVAHQNVEGIPAKHRWLGNS